MNVPPCLPCLPARRSTWRCDVVSALTASVAMLSALPCPGESPAERAPIVPRLTREDLIEKWDLNGDGTLDPEEIEAASAEMRLDGAEPWLETDIDPVTGAAREAEGDTEEPFEHRGQPQPLAVDELIATLGLEPLDVPPDPSPKPTPPPRVFGFPLRHDRARGTIESPIERPSVVPGTPIRGPVAQCRSCRSRRCRRGTPPEATATGAAS